MLSDLSRAGICAKPGKHSTGAETSDSNPNADADTQKCAQGYSFTDAERHTPSGNPRAAESLAARFAAKEAVAKALGAPGGMRWHDCEVVIDPDGRPWLTVSGTVAAVARDRGIRRWHLSLSHDGGVAVAMVVAER